MCLVAFDIAPAARFPWLLASNRDEFFGRPALPMRWWQPDDGAGELLSGRDVDAGGTWLGLDRRGRLALVTNVREPGRVLPGSPSRGALVPAWLQAPDAAAEAAVLAGMAEVPRNGFNFVAADLRTAGGTWFSNRPSPQRRGIVAGTWGLSNAALQTPWPKVTRLQQRLLQARTGAATARGLIDAALAALADPAPAPDADLPSTGVPLARERQLSPAFIRIADAGGVYGTRCSTVVLVEQRAGGRVVHVVERTHDADGQAAGEVAESFDLPPAGG